MTTSLQLDGEDGSGVWGNMQGMYREAVGSMQQLLRRPEDSRPAPASAQAPVSSPGLCSPLWTSKSGLCVKGVVQAVWRMALVDRDDSCI